MFYTGRQPLILAFLIALVLSASFALVLYVNEDLRQSTFALLVEEENEEGEIVKKVKVERPEPNRDQVREIARHQELKKRENLKEKAKEIRRTIIEIEEVAEARKNSLDKLDEWDRLSALAANLKLQAGAGLERIWKSKHLKNLEGLISVGQSMKLEAEQHADAMRILALAKEVDREDAWKVLYQAREVLGDTEVVFRSIDKAYKETLAAHRGKELDREENKLEIHFEHEAGDAAAILAFAEDYVAQLEALVLGPDGKPELAENAEAAAEAAGDAADESELAETEGMEGLDALDLDGLETSDPNEDDEGNVQDALATDADQADAEANENREDALAANESAPNEETSSEENSLSADLPTDQELDQMSTSELYETLQEMAEKVDEAFAENQASELAKMKQLSMEEAREQVFKPKTDTGPDLEDALSKNNPSTSDEFKEFNEALTAAENAAEKMARTAESRRDKVTGNSDKNSQEKKQGSELQEALQKGSQIQAEMAQAARNAGRKPGNVQDMRALMQQSYALQGSPGGGTMNGEFISNMYDGEFGPVKTPNRDQIKLDSKRTLAQALPGRRFDMDSERKGWIFLDTWYVIGPWTLPPVNSFDVPFPPETLVDLDATYDGKPHPRTKEPMELKWRFVQTENIRINPPDEISGAVYYAYTEVFCETQMEVVVAVASDDRAKLWVNDLVVFQDEGLSGWRLDEGFRRILLKPGYNTVLVRLENGPAVTYFSVLMCPADVLAAK